MGTPFLAEIRIVSFNFAPRGWALCNGQLLPINQNQALFSILGTTYGGDGRVTFALPDFRGRIPVHVGNGTTLGERSGEEFHTLNISELPAHNHFVQAQTADAATPTPTNNFLAGIPSYAYRNSLSSLTTLNPAVVPPVGGSQPHENRQPYLVLNFAIALQGVFPSQN
jgi:microcystin-dependent protein